MSIFPPFGLLWRFICEQGIACTCTNTIACEEIKSTRAPNGPNVGTSAHILRAILCTRKFCWNSQSWLFILNLFWCIVPNNWHSHIFFTEMLYFMFCFFSRNEILRNFNETRNHAQHRKVHYRRYITVNYRPLRKQPVNQAPQIERFSTLCALMCTIFFRENWTKPWKPNQPQLFSCIGFLC